MMVSERDIVLSFEEIEHGEGLFFLAFHVPNLYFQSMIELILDVCDILI